MEVYRLEVFDASSPAPRLRWFDTRGRMVQRVLDRSAIDEFIAEVEQNYQVLGADLADLGAALYRWLDGPTERWLGAARETHLPIGLHLDCDGRLRHLPWELIHDGGGFLAVSAAQPVCPVRCASPRESGAPPVANRPLRVLFMASSPVDVAPVLDFEREEAMILAAAANLVEVVVEENGSLEGLRAVVTFFGEGYFDVLHVSGHATLGPSGPRFVLENEIGMRQDATAAEIADALGHSWPPLVFVSGCHTGGASSEGDLASMAEALVLAGAPAVLGWALPVGDHAASQVAAVLYGGLATGGRLDWSVAAARRALFTANSAYWHLLRLYADRTPLGPFATPPAHQGRVKLRARPVSELFLGPSGEVRVASSEGFVGRRRELQRCLRGLRPVGGIGPQLLILHGMGGLGKSTLAARLLDRMRTTHPKQAVWVGQIDENEICKLTDRVTLDATSHLLINQLLTQPGLRLEERLRFILDGPLADVACVFVFDDFEHGNLESDGTGGYVCTPAALEVVTALATAIARTGSQSRVIITSRHDFPLPPGVAAQRESLVPLRGADLEKKLQLTTNLGSFSALAPEVRRHAISAAAGIPRLVERLDRLISDPGTDHEQILGMVDAIAVEYREELLAETLLAAQQPEARRLLALAAIYEIPVPVGAIAALIQGDAFAAPLARAVAVGLIDAGPHPTSGEVRYLVSNLLKPLLDGIPERLTDDDRVAALGRGARVLYEMWVLPDGQ